MSRVAWVIRWLDARRARHGLLAFAAGAGLTFLAALVLVSPRFVGSGPSMIDDWQEIRYAPVAWDQLQHLNFDPAAYDLGRFRPAFWGVWAQLQWHTLGAPESMAGPHLWNLLRLALFALAMAGVTFAVLSIVRPDLGTGWTALLTAAPGLLVLATPQMGVDFERFGPQEPLLFGAMAGGLLLCGLAARAALERGPRAREFALALAGVLLFAFGAYIKEASVCVLVLLPFLPFRRLREQWRALTGSARAFVVAIVVLLAVPIVHVAVEIAKLYSGPRLVYGADRPHGIGGTISRFIEVTGDQWRGIGDVSGSPLWQILFLLLPIAVAVQWWRTRRFPRLEAALLVLALALLVFQGMTAAVESRYYIPVAAVAGVVLASLVARLPTRYRQWAVVVLAVIFVAQLRAAGGSTYGYADQERKSLHFVDAVASLNPASCRVYGARIDVETRHALPELLALRPGTAKSCEPGYDALLVRGTDFPTTGEDLREDAPTVAACDSGWKPLRVIDRAQILGCKRLRAGAPGDHRIVPNRSTVADA